MECVAELLDERRTGRRLLIRAQVAGHAKLLFAIGIHSRMRSRELDLPCERYDPAVDPASR